MNYMIKMIPALLFAVFLSAGVQARILAAAGNKPVTAGPG